MKTTYLEYYKQVLDKVAFDPRLFGKEYTKASKALDLSEKEELDRWLQERGLHHRTSDLHPVTEGHPLYSRLNDFQYYKVWSSI